MFIQNHNLIIDHQVIEIIIIRITIIIIIIIICNNKYLMD